MKKNWDIFCKVVDNFGDIGICWRLAQQLHIEHGLKIRLWVDDLESTQKIIISLNSKLNQQVVDGIVILKWSGEDKKPEVNFLPAANVVIEAFACGLPDAYLASMAQQQSKWVNLEYLSAEAWVDDFHAKPSPKPELKLTRHFYFPGFTEKTGGLIRESNLIVGHSDESRHLMNGKNSDSSFRHNDIDKVLKISLFCYPFAPINDLLDALHANNHAALVYVPQSSILPNIATFFGKKNVNVGDKLVKNNLMVEILPFLSQADYDNLLTACDLNFVRGEDSWIRAIWAGKPFIWQPYIQDENAHMIKLDAFLNVFYTNFDKKKSACEAHRCWSSGGSAAQLPNDVLGAYLADLNAIHLHTFERASQLAKQADLAAKLVIFCNKL